jgi:hypothetical protein
MSTRLSRAAAALVFGALSISVAFADGPSDSAPAGGRSDLRSGVLQWPEIHTSQGSIDVQNYKLNIGGSYYTNSQGGTGGTAQGEASKIFVLPYSDPNERTTKTHIYNYREEKYTSEYESTEGLMLQPRLALKLDYNYGKGKVDRIELTGPAAAIYRYNRISYDSRSIDALDAEHLKQKDALEKTIDEKYKPLIQTEKYAAENAMSDCREKANTPRYGKVPCPEAEAHDAKAAELQKEWDSYKGEQMNQLVAAQKKAHDLALSKDKPYSSFDVSALNAEYVYKDIKGMDMRQNGIVLNAVDVNGHTSVRFNGHNTDLCAGARPLGQFTLGDNNILGTRQAGIWHPVSGYLCLGTSLGPVGYLRDTGSIDIGIGMNQHDYRDGSVNSDGSPKTLTSTLYYVQVGNELALEKIGGSPVSATYTIGVENSHADGLGNTLNIQHNVGLKAAF